MPKPSLIVHGGAWSIPEEAIADCRAGCQRGLAAGWRILSQGGNALDAVEAAIVVLEDDPVFDGQVQLDAIVMDGATLRSGAVAVLERIRNPIRLARRVMESSGHSLLAGAGAEQFALESGMALCPPEELVLERERQAWLRCASSEGHKSGHHFGEHSGTVGAIALDSQGRLVAGTSTGGTCCKRSGRVGDSPLIGCGCYADAEAGAASCTGWGEAIMKVVLAKAAVDAMRQGASAHQAAERCVSLLARRAHGTGGLILLDREGNPGAAYNTSHMAWGCVAPGGTFSVAV
jgi:beta-aspartyl-peptidase (threonine type)